MEFTLSLEFKFSSQHYYIQISVTTDNASLL